MQNNGRYTFEARGSKGDKLAKAIKLGSLIAGGLGSSSASSKAESAATNTSLDNALSSPAMMDAGQPSPVLTIPPDDTTQQPEQPVAQTTLTSPISATPSSSASTQTQPTTQTPMVDVNKYLGDKPGFWRRGLSILAMNKDPLDTYQARADRYNELTVQDQLANARIAKEQAFEEKKLAIENAYKNGEISTEQANKLTLENLRHNNTKDEIVASNNSRVMGDNGLLTNDESLANYGEAQRPYVTPLAKSALQDSIDKHSFGSAASQLGTSKANIDNTIVNRPLYQSNREAGMNATELAPTLANDMTRAQTTRMLKMPFFESTATGNRGLAVDPNDPSGTVIYDMPSQVPAKEEALSQRLQTLGVTMPGVTTPTLSMPALMQQNKTNKVPIMGYGARLRKYDDQGNPIIR